MICFAHRGANKEYPENTLLAFEKALKIGTNGLELDVHQTKDKRIVIIHDEDMERTYKGKGLVCEYTLEELRSFKSRHSLFQDDPRSQLPTLEEVFDLLKDYKDVILNIELKTDQIRYINIEQAVIKMIRDYGYEKRVFLSSFNPSSLRECKKLAADIETGLLYEYPIEDIISYAKELQLNALHPYVEHVSREFIENCHKAGLKVNTYTVNSPARMRKLIESGIDGIFTDVPDLLLEIMQEYR